MNNNTEEETRAPHQLIPTESLDIVAMKMDEIRGKFTSGENYDPNDLSSAESYYGISARDWVEIIRLEDGALLAMSTLFRLLKYNYEEEQE